MTLRPDLIQSALIDLCKSRAGIVAEVTSDEIREDHWQGTEFTYPNTRLNMISNRPTEKECNRWAFELSWQVFSEEASSYQADRIAGIINNALHDKQFTSNSIHIGLWTTNIIPAVRVSEKLWRTEVLQRGTASG